MNLHKGIALLLTVPLLLASCFGRKEIEHRAATFLSVNGRQYDAPMKVSSEGAALKIDVSCDADWTVRIPEDASWIVQGERTPAGRNKWILNLEVAPSTETYPRSADLVFICERYSRVVTVNQEAPDILTMNRVPGFYGIEGSGNVILGGKRQSSSFHFGKTWTYRIMDLQSLTVWSLADIPEDLKAGDTIISMRLKTVSGGMGEGIHYYTDVSVVRNAGGTVWLKKDDSTYFIVER